MPSKKIESGRSLVETLAVLVVIAILLLAGLAGYNFTIHKYKKDQTIKAISELAVRYKLHPISKTGLIEIKSIYPEAERADAVNMKTADTDTGRVQLEVSKDTSYFAVVVNNILDDSCAEYLEKGEYDAALLLNGETYNSKPDKEYLAFGKDFLKDFDLTKLTDEQKGKLSEVGLNIHSDKEAVINVICAGASQAKTAAFVFGDKCPKRGASHYIDGKCWPCPKGEKEDRYGACCNERRIDGPNAKEYCYVCGCPTGSHCDNEGADATYQCVECIENDKGREGSTVCQQLYGSERPFCDTTRHVCVQCTEEGGCGKDENNCPTHCNLRTHTCSNACDLSTGLWKLSGDICICNKTLHEGDACSTTCGVDCCPSESPCKSGRCCPTDLPGYNELCVAGCGCNSGAHLVCNSGNRCDCDEANGYYWDESSKQCIKGCRFGGTLHHVGDIGTCGICQADGVIGIKSTVEADCCNTDNWQLKTGTAIGTCGQCTASGSIARRSDVDEVCCNGAPNWLLKWESKTKACGMATCCGSRETCVTNGVNNTCCTNNGENATTDNPALCSSDNCCKSGNCSGLTATENGHCCASGKVWNGTSCSDPVCLIVTEKSVCNKNATATTDAGNCCGTASSGTELSCVGPYDGNNGHCCASGKVWNGTSCADPVCLIVTEKSECDKNATATTDAAKCCGKDTSGEQLFCVGPYTGADGNNGHCCPDTQTWDETNKKCVTPVCSLTEGSECSASGLAPNCCSTNLSCVSTDAQGNNGHCCPDTQTWDETNKKCVTPVCSLAEGSECSANGLVPNCCGKNSNGADLFCVSTDAQGNNGHCCPEGQVWVDGQGCGVASCPEDKALYVRSVKARKPQGDDISICCTEDQGVLLRAPSGAEDQIQRAIKGWLKGGDQPYYCCPHERYHENRVSCQEKGCTDTMTNYCCAVNHEYVAADNKCCKSARVYYTANGEKRCCEGGTMIHSPVNPEHTICCPPDWWWSSTYVRCLPLIACCSGCGCSCGKRIPDGHWRAEYSNLGSFYGKDNKCSWDIGNRSGNDCNPPDSFEVWGGTYVSFSANGTKPGENCSAGLTYELYPI